MEGTLYIGEAIRRGRREKKLSQKQLAEILEVSPALVSFWENNTRIPSGDDLIRIARYLDIVQLLFPDYEVRKRTKDITADEQYPLVLREEIAQYRRETLLIKEELRILQQQLKKLVDDREKQSSSC